ncbi:acyltransferase [Vibrio sp.]|nr:acyltransferase [Vibrio sp.]
MQYINNLRGLAILLIILTHIISLYHLDNDAFRVVANLLSNSTVTFVMVAGFLFFHLTEKFHYFRFLKGKARSILIPYLFFSIPAILMYTLGLKNSHAWIDLAQLEAENNIIGQVAFYLATGAHLGPFWFIPMIFLVYLVSPVLFWLKKGHAILLVTAVLLIVSFIIGRPELDDNTLQSFIFFLPTFLIGMILAKYNVTMTMKVMPILSAYIIVLLAVYFFVDVSSSLDLVMKMVLSTLLFFLFKNTFNTPNKYLGLMARLSFYLFFVHGFIIGALRMAIPTEHFVMPLLTVPILFSLVIFMCLSIYVGLRMVFGERIRLFIGY